MGGKAKVRIINLSSELGRYLLTRNSIKAIFNQINSSKEDEFLIDFINVDFISRSCADEYLNEKKDTYKRITERNQNEYIKKMFRIASKSDNRISFSNKNRDDIIII